MVFVCVRRVARVAGFRGVGAARCDGRGAADDGVVEERRVVHVALKHHLTIAVVEDIVAIEQIVCEDVIVGGASVLDRKSVV